MPIFDPNTEQDILPNVGVTETGSLEEYQERRKALLVRAKTRPAHSGDTPVCSNAALTARLSPVMQRRIGFQRQ